MSNSVSVTKKAEDAYLSSAPIHPHRFWWSPSYSFLGIILVISCFCCVCLYSLSGLYTCMDFVALNLLIFSNLGFLNYSFNRFCSSSFSPLFPSSGIDCYHMRKRATINSDANAAKFNVVALNNKKMLTH